MRGCTLTTLLNSGVTRPTFTKFAHNIARSSHQMNLSKPFKIRLAILQFISECQGYE